MNAGLCATHTHTHAHVPFFFPIASWCMSEPYAGPSSMSCSLSLKETEIIDP